MGSVISNGRKNKKKQAGRSLLTPMNTLKLHIPTTI